jgi:hypothetical protein
MAAARYRIKAVVRSLPEASPIKVLAHPNISGITIGGP